MIETRRLKITLLLALGTILAAVNVAIWFDPWNMRGFLLSTGQSTKAQLGPDLLDVELTLHRDATFHVSEEYYYNSYPNADAHAETTIILPVTTKYNRSDGKIFDIIRNEEKVTIFRSRDHTEAGANLEFIRVNNKETEGLAVRFNKDTFGNGPLVIQVSYLVKNLAAEIKADRNLRYRISGLTELKPQKVLVRIVNESEKQINQVGPLNNKLI